MSYSNGSKLHLLQASQQVPVNPLEKQNRRARQQNGVLEMALPAGDGRRRVQGDKHLPQSDFAFVSAHCSPAAPH